MLVLKFGGTSVGSPGAIGKVVEILKDGDHRDRTGVVVVSAFSAVTDSLIDIAARAAAGDPSWKTAAGPVLARHRKTASFFLKGDARKRAAAGMDVLCAELIRTLDGVGILRELSKRTLDLVMSFGERFSASLLAHILTARGVEARYLDARDLVKTDDNFGRARFLPKESYARIRSFFSSGGEKKRPLYICTGFIGSTLEGLTTTLGRGGSDLSAAIFGAALGAEELEIWTDVDGILTADPKLVKTVFRLEEISYEEAMELSHFGAKVLFPPTIRPALEKGIPIRIRNTFNRENTGTRIVKNAAESACPVRGISSMNRVALVRVQGSGMMGVSGFSARLFGALARRGISVILITQSSSEYSICFAVPPEDRKSAEEAIMEEFGREIAQGAIDKPVCNEDVSIVAVVGARMKRTSGISGKVFHALGRNGVNVVAIAQGSSELNISAVVSRQDEAKALNAVHEAFFLSEVRSVNLFLVGIGLIGGTLLDQIAVHQTEVPGEIPADRHRIRIRVVGAANSKRMIFRGEGIDPKKVKTLLKGEGGETEALDLPRFIKTMKAMNLPNTCFCDCTAGGGVPPAYADILQSSIPVVTPNKRANSGTLSYYLLLTGCSRERGIPYLYETTVCAGLPVISTLRDLSMSGDRVRRIEAVLSGTLSFIFNNFDGKKRFSALVREARASGYTEPDPRDDLNAMDAARKALILARECGMPLEFSGVAVEPILPKSCFRPKDVESFFTELEKFDAAFEKRRAEAAAAGKALRYVAVIEGGQVNLSLRSEGERSPFRTLTDSDNMVVITTDRYSVLPMVIKGPGAGAQVTAGGVFADIVRIARTLV